MQGGHDYFRFFGRNLYNCFVSFFSLSFSVLSAAFRFWLSLQKLNSICFWSVTSVGENKEKVNTIQPPPPFSCVFLTFKHSKRTPQNDRIGPLHDCPQAPGHGTMFPLSCPGRLTLEVQHLALALWLWAPSAFAQAQRSVNARFREFRPRVFAIFAQKSKGYIPHSTKMIQGMTRDSNTSNTPVLRQLNKFYKLV